MKMYLSSFRLGLYPAELVRLAGGRGARTALINNAVDHASEGDRAIASSDVMTELRSIGLDPIELDLRTTSAKPRIYIRFSRACSCCGFVVATPLY